MKSAWEGAPQLMVPIWYRSGLVTDIVWWSWNWILSLFVQGLTDTLTHHSIQFKESARIVEVNEPWIQNISSVLQSFFDNSILMMLMMITVVPSPDHSTSRCGWSRREPVRVWELDPTNLAMSEEIFTESIAIFLNNHKELLFTCFYCYITLSY